MPIFFLRNFPPVQTTTLTTYNKYVIHLSQVMAEYNKSVICFENTLKIQPDFKAAAERKYAVKCHSKLEAALEAQHK